MEGKYESRRWTYALKFCRLILFHGPTHFREFRRLGNGAGTLDDAKVRQGLEAIGFACSEAERSEIERESSPYGSVEVEKLLDLCRVCAHLKQSLTQC